MRVVVALSILLGACTPASTSPRPTAAPPEVSAAARAPAQVIALSDIHFDPFYDPSIFSDLMASPASRWRAILDRSKKVELGPFGTETSDPLWRSTLAAMAQAVPEPAAILISGDFLAHQFVETFAAHAPGRDEAALESFVEKTITLLASDLRRTFPRAQILPALGNNDSPCGNYMSQPNSPFLARLADAFRDPTSTGADDDVAAGFAGNGYYSAPMRFNPRLRVAVLNSTYWSVAYKNRCGTSGNKAPGEEELAWIGAELERAASRGEQMWLMGHMPPGLDLFATLNHNANPCGGKYVYMYEESFNARYLSLLDRYRTIVGLSLTGHTHMHELHLIGADREHPIANLTVPAVSTIYKNNPSFIVLKVNPESLAIEDFAVHALPYPDGGTTAPRPVWATEYDFDQAYGQRGFSGESVQAIIRSLHGEPALRKLYIRYFSSGRDAPNLVFRDSKLYECSMFGLDAEHFERCYCGAK